MWKQRSYLVLWLSQIKRLLWNNFIQTETIFSHDIRIVCKILFLGNWESLPKYFLPLYPNLASEYSHHVMILEYLVFGKMEMFGYFLGCVFDLFFFKPHTLIYRMASHHIEEYLRLKVYTHLSKKNRAYKHYNKQTNISNIHLNFGIFNTLLHPGNHQRGQYRMLKGMHLI